MVNLAALLINIVLIPTLSGNAHLLWTLFILFTFLHIFANYKAVTCVVMDTLNYARFKVVFNHCYVNPGLGEILSPKEANALEPIIGGMLLYSCHRWQKFIQLHTKVLAALG